MVHQTHASHAAVVHFCQRNTYAGSCARVKQQIRSVQRRRAAELHRESFLLNTTLVQISGVISIFVPIEHIKKPALSHLAGSFIMHGERERQRYAGAAVGEAGMRRWG